MTHNVSISYQRVGLWDSPCSSRLQGKFDDITYYPVFTNLMNGVKQGKVILNSYPVRRNWALQTGQPALQTLLLLRLKSEIFYIFLYFLTSVLKSLSVVSVPVEDEVIIEDDEREVERVLDLLLTFSANSRLLQALKTLPCLFCRWISNEGWNPPAER